MVIAMSERGARPDRVASAVEDRWHSEYPATNNAVSNGALVAIAVWFGEGDFLQTANLAYSAADFTDADCNAANSAAVVGAMKGMKGLPPALVSRLRDHIHGSVMGGVQLTPPVDESISGLAGRTADIAGRHRQLQRRHAFVGRVGLCAACQQQVDNTGVLLHVLGCGHNRRGAKSALAVRIAAFVQDFANP